MKNIAHRENKSQPLCVVLILSDYCRIVVKYNDDEALA